MIPGLSAPAAPASPQLVQQQEEPASQSTQPVETDFSRQVLETFASELDEKLLLITDGLLALEKGLGEDEFAKTTKEIFRAAHNIKGSGRGVGALDVGEIAHHVENLFSTIQKKSIPVTPEIMNICLQAVDAMREAMQSFTSNKPLSFDLSSLLNSIETGVAQPMEKPMAEIQHSTIPTKKEQYKSIRVSIANLDRVSAYMEEMQINKIAIDHHYSAILKLDINARQLLQTWKKNMFVLKKQLDKHDIEEVQKFDDDTYMPMLTITNSITQMNKDMTTRMNELHLIFNALQDELRLLRLIPVSTLLNTMPRTVRDIAQSLQKPVEVDIKDNDARIDRLVLDGLKDPIVHILRNSIDHGIESPELRKKNNKSQVGHIKINVSEEGNHVLFTIADDGAGVNIEKVKEKALEANLVTQADLNMMSEDEILNLLFLPGFSTKDVVTDISGRGVGLDAVKFNLANLKGEVSISTVSGTGTTFYLRVPLTLSTERGLIVQSSGQLLAITTHSIERVIILKKADIVDVEGCPTILLEQHPVPLFLLSDLLQFTEEQQALPESLFIVVIKKARHTIALLMDNIIGEREIVIKPLQAPLSNIESVAGATLSGSGQIILVLNSLDIINIALTMRKKL